MSHITLTAAVSSVAGKTGAISLVKGDVGLGNVDNTSDANKPVSTAQAAAIAAQTGTSAPVFVVAADATGATDATTAAQAKIDAASSAGGGIVLFPPGIFRLNSGLTVSSSNVRIQGSGRGATTLLQSGSPGAVVAFAGVVPAKASATTTLTADVAWSNLDTSVGAVAAVASSAGLAADDVVLVGDDYVVPWTSSQWNTCFSGELQRVKSVATGVVTFYGRARDSYTVARNAALWKLTPLSGVGISDLTVKNASPGTTTTQMVTFFSCRDVEVRSLNLVGGDGAGVTLNYVYGATVYGVNCLDLTDDAANSRYGYGVNVGPSEGVVVSNCRFRRVRHGVTTNGYGGRCGFARNLLVSSCEASETTGASFDTHPQCSDVSFHSCRASQNNDVGFTIRAPRVRIASCEASYVNNGATFFGAASASSEVVDCNFHHTGGIAVNIGGDATAGYPVDASVQRNRIHDTKTVAINVGGPVAGAVIALNSILRAGDSGANPSAGIYVGDGANPTRIVIRGNSVLYANCAVYVGTGTPDVLIADNRSGSLWNSSPAVLKGNLAASTVVLNGNSTLDVQSGFDAPAPRANSYVYTSSAGASATSNTLGVGSFRAVPWIVRTTALLKAMAVDVSAAGEAGAKLRIGLYADNGLMEPGTLVIDAGQVAADATGLQTATFSNVTLLPGVYWIGAVVQNVTTTQPTVRVPSGWHPPIDVSAGVSAPASAGALIGWQTGSITGALPTTFPAGAPSGFAPRVIARFA